MSFQAYLDAIEEKTGKTPQQLITEAKQKGFTKNTKATEILTWLAKEYKLGRGYGMALIYVIRHGARINTKHVGKQGTHADSSDTLIITGKRK